MPPHRPGNTCLRRRQFWLSWYGRRRLMDVAADHSGWANCTRVADHFSIGAVSSGVTCGTVEDVSDRIH